MEEGNTSKTSNKEASPDKGIGSNIKVNAHFRPAEWSRSLVGIIRPTAGGKDWQFTTFYQTINIPERLMALSLTDAINEWFLNKLMESRRENKWF